MYLAKTFKTLTAEFIFPKMMLKKFDTVLNNSRHYHLPLGHTFSEGRSLDQQVALFLTSWSDYKAVI